MDTNAIYRTAKESFKLFCSLFFRLNSYHVNIEKQAQNMLLRLAEQIHKRVKIGKQLKKIIHMNGENCKQGNHLCKVFSDKE